MTASARFEILLVTAPGLEAALLAEVRERHFNLAKAINGGVTIEGGWREVWRANLELRGVVRVLARVGSFRALHLAQLDKRARKFPWADVLRRDVPVKVEASCSGSRIYHAGAVVQRIERALKEEMKIAVSPDAEVIVKARIEDDLCTLSIDTSGESLHKRGNKEATAKAPMRETMAALLLRSCGFTGTEPVVDPMCGSGTLVIEAAEMAAGLNPGRSRHFAFEQLASFDPAKWEKLRSVGAAVSPLVKFRGFDRDAGAIRMSTANAVRAGVSSFTAFTRQVISDLQPPPGPPGLVMVNPPYGTRIGERKSLYGLYGALGKVLLERFGGWRVGLVTTEEGLAKATGLPFGPPNRPISHGGLKVQLWRTGELPGGGASRLAGEEPASTSA